MSKFYHLLSEISEYFLTENRIQFLKDRTEELSTDHDQHADHKNKDDIIDHFANKADPTKNKAHTQWLVNQYKKGNIRQEDHPALHSTLSDFEKYKSKLEKKDINQYKSIGEIRDAVNPHVGTAATKKEESEQGRDEIHSEPGLKVYHLKSKEASQSIYGGGSKLGGNHTDWCTAARSEGNAFHNYAENGNLYTFHKEGDPKSPYQIHIPKDQRLVQFQDRHNESAKLEDLVNHHPAIRNIKEFQNENHPALHTPDHVSKKVAEITSKEHPTAPEKYYVHYALSGTHDTDLLNKHLHNAATHRNPNLTKEQQEKIYNEHGSNNLEYNPRLHPSLIDKIGLNPYHHKETATSGNIIHHVKSGKVTEPYHAKDLLELPGADTSAVNAIHDHGNEKVKRVALGDHRIGHDRVDANIEHPIKAGILAKNTGLSPEHYHKLHSYANKIDGEHIHDHLARNKSVPKDIHLDISEKYKDSNPDIAKQATKLAKSKK